MRTICSLLFFIFAVGWGLQIHAGSILMVHGHIDNPSLWVVQGNALAKASGGTRFYDPTHYYPGMSPAGRFQANGIYGVSYYQAVLGPGQFEPPISPVRVGPTEIPPDDANLTPFLYKQTDTLAARLAQTINNAYAQTGQKVTLICHSMGGLVAEAAIAYFDCENKVEKLITIGTPLRGFPADFRVPAEIIANQSGVRFAYARESLQMSEGVKYGGRALSSYLEDRFKQVKTPSLTAVNIVGTLNPLPENLLGGPSDGVVRAVDARFRDSSLATLYELPLTHMQRIAEVWSAPEDALCLSDRTTQILEKEVLGLNPLPRLASHLSFNYNTSHVRVTVRNDGGLPLTIASVIGRFDFINTTNSTASRVANEPLTGLAGQTLLPGQFLIVDGAAMERGEKASVRLTLTVNGHQLPSGEASFIANIQAPEIELSLRYDFLNSVIQNEWQTKGIGGVRAFALNSSYRLEGHASYDAVSNRLKGTLTANFYGVLTGAVAIASSNLFYSESFPFDLEVGSGLFAGQASEILGKTPVEVADAAASQLRSLYRAHLLPLVTNPGPFLVEGNFSALAGLKLERPIFQFDPETQGVRLNFGATLILGFSDPERSLQLHIPMQASCSTVFVNTPEGLVMKPQLKRLSLAGMALGESYRLLINKVIEGNTFIVVPAEFTANLNSKLRDGLEELLGASALPKNFAFFDSATVAVEAGSTRFRILIDLYDDASNDSQNAFVGVSENGILIQDRLLNQFINRSADYVNLGLSKSGLNEIKFHKLVSLGGYVAQMPVGFGAGFEIKLYLDKVRITLEPDGGRELAAKFTGPNNRVEIDLPVNGRFFNQIRTYAVWRVGIEVFGQFVGRTKREEIRQARISVTDTLAVDIDANIYPYVNGTNGTTTVGVFFPPREIDIEVRSSRSSPGLAVIGELVVEPLFKLAKNHPESYALLGGFAGYILAPFAPVALEGEAERRLGDEATNETLLASVRESPSNTRTNRAGTNIVSGVPDFPDHFSSGFFDTYDVDLSLIPVEDRRSKSFLQMAGLAVGATAGRELGEQLKDAFNPRQLETTVDLPANIQLTDLTINSRVARLDFDVKPAYGRIYVDRITGLNATNGVVRLSRDDFSFSSFDGGPSSLTYASGGEQTVFSTVWVKRRLSKIRMHLRYEAIYLHRYNTNAHPGYTLQLLGGASGSFTTPVDYKFNSERDVSTFTVEVPVFEGQT